MKVRVAQKKRCLEKWLAMGARATPGGQGAGQPRGPLRTGSAPLPVRRQVARQVVGDVEPGELLADEGMAGGWPLRGILERAVQEVDFARPLRTGICHRRPAGAAEIALHAGRGGVGRAERRHRSPAARTRRADSLHNGNASPTSADPRTHRRWRGTDNGPWWWSTARTSMAEGVTCYSAMARHECSASTPLAPAATFAEHEHRRAPH